MRGPGPLWSGEPEHLRRRLRKHGGWIPGAAWLQVEDCRWRSGGTGQRTRRARERHMPGPVRARQVPGGTSTPGTNLHIKDHDRMGRGPRMWKYGGVHGSSGPRPGRDMIRRDRQFARTRMSPYTAYFESAVQQGFKTLATVYKRKSNVPLLTSC